MAPKEQVDCPVVHSNGLPFSTRLSPDELLLLNVPPFAGLPDVFCWQVLSPTLQAYGQTRSCS